MVKRDPLNQFIGSRVKTARQNAGLTQSALAERIDKSTTFIGSLETGVNGLSVPTLLKICEVLHVSPDYLLVEHPSGNDAHLKLYLERIKSLDPSESELVENVTIALIDSLKKNSSS